MAIAKGRTDCEAERDTIVQGFVDMLKVLKQAKNQKENGIKSVLYDILTDHSFSAEEQRDSMRPYEDLLSEQEEIDIRIRRAIFIGLFSFWEISLRDITSYYGLSCVSSRQKNEKNEQPQKPQKLSACIKAIFSDKAPECAITIADGIRELRNYMTHGSLNPDRIQAIDLLRKSHPEFCIAKCQPEYYFSSYTGIETLTDYIVQTLRLAEEAAKSNKDQKQDTIIK